VGTTPKIEKTSGTHNIMQHFMLIGATVVEISVTGHRKKQVSQQAAYPTDARGAVKTMCDTLTLLFKGNITSLSLIVMPLSSLLKT